MQCAIYCRLSREDDDKQLESESIQNQKSLLINYAFERGWDIYKIYCDEDYSGADRFRPDFCQMLSDAQLSKFNIILCKTLSRFTRDMELVERYIHGKFPIWGIRFIAVVDNVDTEVKGNKKARQISGLINEWYLEDLSDNIKTVFDHKRRNGIYIGSFALYGYLKHPTEKGTLIVDEEAAQVVRQIFHLSLEGFGKSQIAKMLNEQGIPNPTKYKQLHGFHYVNGSERNDSSTWNKNTVCRILRNEMYLGTMVQGRRFKPSCKNKTLIDLPPDKWIRVENTHEAIIGRETFDQVQKNMNHRTRTDGSGEIHVLAGRVKCMDCGSTMSKTSNNYKGIKRSYLRCSLFVSGSSINRCTRHSIRLDRLTDLVGEKIHEYIEWCFGDYDISSLVSQFQSKTRANTLEKELKTIQFQIEKRGAALRSIYLDKTSGLIDDSQFAELNKAFLEEKSSLEVQASKLIKKMKHDLFDNENDMIFQSRNLLNFEALTPELVSLLIDKIEIGEYKSDTKKQNIIIRWKF